jgi:DNA-binding NtrC family response regulator
VAYTWPGNVRQLKNVTEQISVIEENRVIGPEILQKYLPGYNSNKLPALIKGANDEPSFANEREILYKILFDMRNDVNDLKKLVLTMLEGDSEHVTHREETKGIISNLYKGVENVLPKTHKINSESTSIIHEQPIYHDTEELTEESLSLIDKEKEMIIRALDKYNGRRKNAAQELGISERTLYRKIKEYNLE